MNKRELGKRGEEIAAQYLQKMGMELLAQNFRTKRGEIDLILNDCGTLVFVEVKTATTPVFGPPETWVDRKKQHKVAHVAQEYLWQNRIENRDCRFDVIGVWYNPQLTIKHYRNAFWME
ncbi:YraN family protein [candidate division KSB1 bacterium]|jgi:putative endonuclease|nr:YraN family protein [candidate division KSB1 bacterium]